MTRERTARALSWYTIAVTRSSVYRVHILRLLPRTYGFGVVAAVILFLAGCGDGGDGGHGREDDFLVSFPSPFEIMIRRPFNRPFGVVEIGVTPFVDPVLGPEPYVLVVSGIAFSDGAELVVEAHDVVRSAFIDPLGELVVDVLLTCDCFVDYVILRSSFGETAITFD